MQQDNAAARRLLDDGFATLERLDDAPEVWQGIARVRFLQALVAWHDDDGPRMVALVEEAHARFRAVDDGAGKGFCCVVLAIVALAAGDHDAALARLDDAFALCDASGFTWGKVPARYYRGEILADRGDYATATAAYLESARLSWNLGDAWATGAALGSLGALAAAHGRAEDAARLFGTADALLTTTGAILPTLDRDHHARMVATVRASLGRDAFAAVHDAGALVTPDAAITLAEELAAQTADAASSPPTPAHEFTPRELDVLRLLVEGHEDAEIARSLGLSPRTISEHITRMRTKLGLANRTALAVFVVRRQVT